MTNLASMFSGLIIDANVLETVKTSITIAINCIFPTIMIFMLLAGLIGYKRGIWRVTYNVFMLLIFYLTAFFTLNPLVRTLFNLDLGFTGFTNVVITNTKTGVSYYAPVTNLLDTFTEVVEGFYVLFGVEADPTKAAGFALAIAGSLLKLIIVIVDVLLITLFGWLVSLIFWHACFKHLIPQIAIKLTKLRWVSMLENAVKYLVITLLFMSPTTAIVNSINQAYQRSKSEMDTQSETIQNIGDFLDAYNNSLFAQTFFNWTADKDGLTFDARFIAKLTEYSINGSTVSLTGEFNNMLSSLGVVLNIVDYNFETNKPESINYESLMTKEMIETLFGIIKKSPGKK